MGIRLKLYAVILLSQWLLATTAFAHCSISVQDMIFGNYDVPNPMPTTSSAAINLDCKAPVLVTINIGPSLTTGTIANRAMHHVSRSDTLAYNLFRDSTMTQVWGDESQGGSNNVRIDKRMTLWIYGKLYQNQDVWVGNYSDSVTVTVLP